MSTFRYPKNKGSFTTKPHFIKQRIRYDEPAPASAFAMADDVPQKEIPRLRYPEELSKESFERDFAAKSEPATWMFFSLFHFWVSFVFLTFFFT